MRGFAAQTVAAHHIHAELRSAAIFAWSAFLAVFLAISYFHDQILFDPGKNNLRSISAYLYNKSFVIGFKKQLYKDLY